MIVNKHILLMKRRYHMKMAQYFLMRHAIPLSPRDLRAFRAGPRVFANSIPKAGTNLIKRMVNLLPCMAPRWTYHIDERIPGAIKQLQYGRRGQLLTAHMAWRQELADLLSEKEFKVLFILRDPRDVLVSFVDYVTRKDPSHFLYAYYNSLSSDHERLMASITGIDGPPLPDAIPLKSIKEQIEDYLPWMDEPSCFVFRFEDLIGSAGGGSDERQFETVKRIMRHVGLDPLAKEVAEVAEKVFYTKSRTFHKGAIGDWKNHFTEEHKRLFKDIAGRALIKMGYEKGTDW